MTAKQLLSDEQLATLIYNLRIMIAAAPAGPWSYTESSGYRNPGVRTPTGPLFSTGNAGASISRNKRVCAAHYAAAISPDVLAALLDTLEQTIDERDALVVAVDKLSEHVEQLALQAERVAGIFKIDAA